MIKVCVVGGKGNMGRRYLAILDHLGVESVSVDRGDRIPEKITHYIVATPTSLHGHTLGRIPRNEDNPVPILCEKPIMVTNNMAALHGIEFLRKNGRKIYMVNQYAYYFDKMPQKSGITCYDYYNSGGDGVAWDCIQIIHLARGEITTLANKSPVWRCVINGIELRRDMIDLCYIKMIRDFISDGLEYGRLWGWDDIKASHEKVIRINSDFDRCSGQIR